MLEERVELAWAVGGGVGIKLGLGALLSIPMQTDSSMVWANPPPFPPNQHPLN